MDLNIDLKNINVSDLKEKLQAIDKKTLIKFGIGFAAIIIFLIGYYTILNPIVKNKKALYEEKVLKQDEIVQFENEIKEISIVGDIRHKGMLMGIELVSNKKKKIPIHTKKSINKIFFEEGKKQGIYLRTLGNIVMLVPPLSIRENELEMLLTRTVKTIQAAKSKII